MKKFLSFLSVLFLFFTFAQCSYAEEILIPQKTKLSVKLTDDFSTLKVGDKKKISINLIGVVSKIDKRYNSDTASYSYYLTMKFVGLVFDEDNLFKDSNEQKLK